VGDYDRSSSGEEGDSAESGGASPGIERCSEIQAPRSISLQRSLQKGRKGALSDHSICRPQVGHLTRAFTAGFPRQVQELSTNGTSTSLWVGRAVSPFQLRNRRLQR
jgi:hypothetical protein